MKLNQTRYRFRYNAFILFFFVFFSTIGYSQNSIAPKFIDDLTKEVVGNVTVKLFNNSDTLIAITNNKGIVNFSNITGPSIRIVANAISYKTIDTTITLSKNADLTFYLFSEIKQLNDVTVTAKQIRSSINKLTYNVTETDRKKNTTGIELLSTVPQINTTPDGTIYVKGHSNIQILIDGKPLLNNVILNSISPKVISKIEIQANPQAEYSGSGLYSIVNIITVKDWKGYYGNLSSTIGTNSNYTPSLYFSYKNKKIETNIMGGINLYKREGDYQITSAFTNSDKIEFKQASNNKAASLYTTFGFKYMINAKSNINYAFSYNLSNYNNMTNSKYFKTAFQQSSSLIQLFTQKRKLNIPYYKNYIDYTKVINSKSNLTIAFLSVLQQTKQKTDNDIDNITFLSKSRITNRPSLNEISSQINYRRTVNENTNYNIGIKWISRINKSNYRLDTFNYNINNYEIVNDNSYTNSFYAKQDILATFGNISFPLSKKITGEAGLRLEQTLDNLDFNSGAKIKRNYFQIIPNATIYYAINDNSYLSLDFNKNIYRPAIFYLNPIANVSNPKNIELGNQALLPEKTYLFSLSFNKSKRSNNFSFSAYFQKSADLIALALFSKSGDTVISKYINTASAQVVGISSDITYNFSKSFRVTVHLAFENNCLSSLTQSNKGLQLISNLNLLYRLPKKFSIRLTHQYNTPYITFQGNGYAQSSNEFLINKRLMKDNLVISLGASDFFKFNSERKTKFETPFVNQSSYSNLNLGYYFIKIFFSFGKSRYSSNPNIKLANTDLKN